MSHDSLIHLSPIITSKLLPKVDFMSCLPVDTDALRYTFLEQHFQLPEDKNAHGCPCKIFDTVISESIVNEWPSSFFAHIRPRTNLSCYDSGVTGIPSHLPVNATTFSEKEIKIPAFTKHARRRMVLSCFFLPVRPDSLLNWGAPQRVWPYQNERIGVRCNAYSGQRVIQSPGLCVVSMRLFMVLLTQSIAH